MSELFTAGLMLYMWIQGFAIAYVIWAPETVFKRAFIDGMTLRFIWGKKE